MKSVAILYGFLEGPLHGRRLVTALRRNGFIITKDADTADLLIAHSGGCYLTPQFRNAQTVLLINPTYWPGKAFGRCMIERLKMDAHFGLRPQNTCFWLYRVLLNGYYFVRRPIHNFRMIRLTFTYDLARSVGNHPTTIIIKNKYDTWLTPNLEHIAAIHGSVTIKKMDGEHDDCWRYPKRYITLLGDKSL